MGMGLREKRHSAARRLGKRRLGGTSAPAKAYPPGPLGHAEEAIPTNPTDLLNVTAQIEGIEWIILLIIFAALFLFGPSKLPELARGFGRALGEFQRGRLEIEREIRGQFAQLPSESKSREQRVAEALGLPTAGKTDTQLKLDIARAIDKAPDEKVTTAATALGVGSADADIPTMRERILRALSQ